MRQFILATALGLTSVVANANIIGSDMQSFNPVSDGGDFVTVQSAGTLRPWTFVIGGFLDEAKNNMAPALDATHAKYRVTDQVLSSDLHFGLGILQNWEVGANIVNTLSSHVDNQTVTDYFTSNGLTDFRLNTKLRFLGSDSDGLAVNFSADFPQVKNDYFYGDSNKPSYAVELIGSKSFGRWLLGANVGYNFRHSGNTIPNGPYEPVGDEWLASAAASYHFAESNWIGVAELFGANPTNATPSYSTDDLMALEALLGAKYEGVKNLELQAGLTTEIYRGTSSPDIRAYVGLNWFPLSRGEAPSQPAPVPEEPKPPVAASEVPPPPTIKQIAPSVYVANNVNFPSGSDTVPQNLYPELKKFADFLKNKPNGYKKLSIQGHTDSRGPKEFNDRLSLKRAVAVKKVMVEEFQADAEKIETKGFGMSSPVASNDTAEGRSQNRRIEFKVED